MKSRSSLAFLILILVVACHDQDSPESSTSTLASPFNGLALDEELKPEFSFLACGNLIGDPKGRFIPPVSSFRKNVRALIQPDDRFLMILGDCLYREDEQELTGLKQFFKTEVPLPVFNAPGNFDLADRETYVKHFGKTWFAFDYQGSRFLVLDSELDAWNISGEQLEFLTKELDDCETNPPRSLFLFSHKPIWAGTRNTVIASLKSNAPSTLSVFNKRRKDATTFNRDIRPKLRDLAQLTEVWFFSGDVGAKEETSLHLFHETDHRAENLHYLAVGLGDLERDALIRVKIRSEGEPRVEAIQLSSGMVLKLSEYNSAYWMQRFYPDGLPAAAAPFIGD